MFPTQFTSRGSAAAFLTMGVLTLSCAVVACQDSAPIQPADEQAEASKDQTAEASSSESNHESFSALLKDVVTKDGLVRYAKLRTPERRAQLKQIVDGYAAAELPEDRAARLALWCNAYNANVLHKVVIAQADPAFESVIKVGGFFDASTIQVASASMTLNDLENTKIRPLGDPRIHAALVCAAMSCPPLRAEAFVASRIDEQFDDQCRRWVNDATKFRANGSNVAASKILDWYGDDFKGGRFADIASFLRKYAETDSELGTLLVRESAPSIEWLPYDWALNDEPPAP